MDVLVDLLLTFLRALITQFVAFLFGKIGSKKSKKKTTRKRSSRGRFSKKKN